MLSRKGQRLNPWNVKGEHVVRQRESLESKGHIHPCLLERDINVQRHTGLKDSMLASSPVISDSKLKSFLTCLHMQDTKYEWNMFLWHFLHEHILHEILCVFQKRRLILRAQAFKALSHYWLQNYRIRNVKTYFAIV